MRFHTLIAFSVISTSTMAADPKPGMLTSEEFAAGWVSLFDGETTFGWTGGGSAVVKDGKWTIGLEKSTVLIPTARLGESWELEIQATGGRLYFGDQLITI